MLFICLFSLKLTAFEAECYDFANFTEADSVAFVEECGIKIPENILLSGQAASFTHSLVVRAYSHPNVRFCFNYYETQDYAEAIRMAVCSHMDFITYTATASESTYQLQFNTVQAEHNHVYDNCVSLNKLSHQFVCACGATGGTGRHYVHYQSLGKW